MAALSRKFVYLGALLALTLVLGVSITQAQSEEVVYSPFAYELEPTVAVEWMQLLYDRIQAERISAPAASRLYGYAGVTLYEAVMPGMPDNRSLSGQVNDLPDLPLPELDRVYDWESTANAALSTVLSGLFENGDPQTLRAFETLRQRLAAGREAEIGEDVVAASLEYGDTLGEALLVWVDGDNYRETRDMEFELFTGDASFWVPTSEGQRAVEPYWGMIRPFALEYADECAQWPNLYFDADPDSTFYAQAMEVKEVGDNLTDEQRDIARFWVDTPGLSGTPAGHWVIIQNVLVDQLNLTLGSAAEMYGMVNMTLADSFISCWSLKYQVNLLRPESYINEYISRSWRPYIETPGFPEYPSGHSVVSAAAADMLTYLYGPVAFTSPGVFGEERMQRTFTSFEAAGDEAAISRLYGGIHYRAAIENGKRQGRCVTEHILDNIIMRPLSQGE